MYGKDLSVWSNLLLAALSVTSPVDGRAQATSYATLNVCQRVPGTVVAAAVSGKPIDEKPVNLTGLTAARCVYGIEIGGARQAFVIWVNPVDDYAGLKDASDPPVTDVKGVGDEAFAVTDADTNRIQLTARVRGKVTVQVTSARRDWAEAVARVALSKF